MIVIAKIINYIYDTTCMIVITNKKGEIESAIMPLYYVFDVNDNLHVGD